MNLREQAQEMSRLSDALNISMKEAYKIIMNEQIKGAK